MTLWPALLVVAAVTGTVDVSDRSEIRVRDSNEPVGRAMDLETTPAVSLRLRSRILDLELGYGVRLTLRQLDHVPLPEVLHHGLLGLRWRFRRGDVSLRNETSYGTQSFASLLLPASPDAAPGTLPVVQLPGVTTLGYVSSRTGLALRFAPSARWTLRVRMEHALSGGTDATARAVIPFQQGPSGGVEAEWAMTRKDRLITGLSVAQATFSPGPDDTMGETQVAWRHRFDRSTGSTLAAGASVVWRRDGGAGGGSGYPVAEASLDHRFGPQRIDTRLSVRLAPVVSWLDGSVDERLVGSAGLTWAPRAITTVRAQVGVAQSVPFSAEGALTVLLGEAAVGLQTARTTRFELGTRSAWQRQRGIDPPPPQWVIFAGAIFDAPMLRF